jgi:hypothetical protein
MPVTARSSSVCGRAGLRVRPLRGCVRAAQREREHGTCRAVDRGLATVAAPARSRPGCRHGLRMARRRYVVAAGSTWCVAHGVVIAQHHDMWPDRAARVAPWSVAAKPRTAGCRQPECHHVARVPGEITPRCGACAGGQLLDSVRFANGVTRPPPESARSSELFAGSRGLSGRGAAAYPLREYGRA